MASSQKSQSNERESDEEISKNPSVEEAADKYYKELLDQLFNLRQELGEEKLVQQELTGIKQDLQGRIGVHCQRMEELGIDSLQNMMAQAKEDLKSAKEEEIGLCRELFGTSLDALEVIGESTNVFEELRIQFTNNAIINQLMTLELEHSQTLENEISNANDAIARKKDAIEKVLCDMNTFANMDVPINQMKEELKKTEGEIEEIGKELRDLQEG